MTENNFTRNLTREDLLSYISFLSAKIDSLEKMINNVVNRSPDLKKIIEAISE